MQKTKIKSFIEDHKCVIAGLFTPFAPIAFLVIILFIFVGIATVESYIDAKQEEKELKKTALEYEEKLALTIANTASLQPGEKVEEITFTTSSQWNFDENSLLTLQMNITAQVKSTKKKSMDWKPYGIR